MLAMVVREGGGMALIGAARPGLYRDWVADRYGLERQIARVLELLRSISA